ncbi:EAL domain-containing protein, partial [Salmonella sp. SAL4457]|uniref:EAL domain-containing protein n=1 Tax=Salmonella sp. SAL4457 TaxID=3159912 RepID=UPI00397CFE1A
LEPSHLILEVTESTAMRDADASLVILEQLSAMGVGISIDDFGTGYSSLSYLKRLPLDILKIDKSFIRGLPDDPHDAAITRAIIALGRSMQLTVIAEGVETEGQQSFLTHEGCEQIQGFVLSPPLPAELFDSKFLKPRQPIGAPREAPV